MASQQGKGETLDYFLGYLYIKLKLGKVSWGIVDFMKGQKEGTPTTLYAQLKAHAKKLGIKVYQRKWPSAPNALGTRRTATTKTIKIMQATVMTVTSSNDGCDDDFSYFSE